MLVFGFWMSAIAAVAYPSPQRQDQKKTAKAPSQVSQQTTDRALAVNEDPRLIGRRNLNKGLIAKLSSRSRWQPQLISSPRVAPDNFSTFRANSLGRQNKHSIL